MKRLRLGLVCDYLEENWISMDLVGDMLYTQFTERYGERLRTDRIRPTMRWRLTRWKGLASSKAAWNADRLINRQLAYPLWLRGTSSRNDIFHVVDHSYAHLALALPPERTVVSCHDLDAFDCLIEPERYPRPRWFQGMARRVLKGMQRAGRVVFATAPVRDRAIELGLVREDRTRLIPLGVHPACEAPSDAAAEEEAARLLEPAGCGPLLLNVGSTIPRKRIDVLLRVFAAARREEPGAKLIRAGGKLNPAQWELARELGVENAVMELPFLPSSALAAVYRRVAMLLQTSDAEGFGLPVAEAQACGCPVIASDLAVLREVGGGAAEYCPVGEVENWRRKSLLLIGERRNQPEAWARRRQAGIENAKRFSWGRTADQLWDVYRELAESRPIKGERAKT